MRGWALRVDDDKFLLEENRSRGAAVIPFGPFLSSVSGYDGEGISRKSLVVGRS